MRWTELFDDLEAQLAAQEAAELLGEVAEHTRAATGQVLLRDRLLADLGRRIHLTLRGGEVLDGALSELARDWFVVQEQLPAQGREVLVVTASVVSVRGLSGRSDQGRRSRVQRSLDLRHALRALSRDRAVVRVRDVEGGVTVGTIDRVGADHLDLSAHPDDLPRRSRDVHSVVTIPYAALACVTRS
ncbi:hypothetical protein FNH13_13545 [Ornithinimicrobium ciconiae]|uniref:Uncharacterized protein n=1 Tax=Ornithinimicrobium ciconiae TaxID=2594265 RepID=A0A516GCG5_9MICO|nr:hypothetical protein [Ornithinimicrobium ciconiae]QDO89224.1 hypothetical protein FNH13_13545 [Ornithinimicrobium ciconiae]